MRALRGTEVPIEHVAAELAAIPLASAASMRLSTIELDPEMRDVSASLWRAAESTLLQSFASFGVDEITALRDWLWFADRKKKATSMVEFVQKTSNAVLSFSGNVFRPKTPPWTQGVSHTPSGSADARARRFWRWVSFALPPDLLMAAHPAPGAVSAEVELLSPILSSILRDRGFVEPHMHLGAAIDFGLLWISTLHAIGDPEAIKEDSFKSAGADLDGGLQFANWLVRAAIARYVLASFLSHHRSGQIDKDASLDRFLGERVLPLFAPPGGKGADPWGRRGAYVDPGRGAGLRICLHEMATGRFIAHTPFPQLQRLYTQLTNIRGRFDRFPETLEKARRADPIGLMFPPRGHRQRSSEMEFVAEAVKYLRTEDGTKDLSFRHLFWQVQRVRARYYRHVVQRPMTPGLQWFTRSYARLFPGRQPLKPRILVASAAEICGMTHGLKSLEFRTSPYADQSSMRNMLVEIGSAFRDLGLVEIVPDRNETEEGAGAEDWAEARRARIRRILDPESGNNIRLRPADATHPEVGIVLHFSRERGGGIAEGAPTAHGRGSYADPSWPKNLGYRYAWYYKQKRREAMTVAGLLKRFPQLLALIRGVDVCTDELGVPNWVVAPLLRYVKDVAAAASAYAQATWNRFLPPLRTTAHAGEDFVHLLGGLRRIEESIEFFRLGQGDRLGHAIALGINPTEWAFRIGGIAMTKIERLFDLAWEWSFCTNRSLNLPGSRIQYILDKTETYSNAIFKRYCDPPQVVQFMELLRQERELRIAQFPDGPLDDEEAYWRRRSRLEPGQARRQMHREEEESRRGRDRGEEPWRLLYAYLTDPEAFKAGQEQVLVDPAFEAESLELIQTELRRKVGASGITIEINPSSNLLIGNMSDFQNHPLWRLKSPQKETGFQVAVCIGSDDPITFATRNLEEYQLIYDTLTLAGLSDMEARQWLEEAREAGLESRFTLPLPQRWDWVPVPTEVDTRHIPQIL